MAGCCCRNFMKVSSVRGLGHVASRGLQGGLRKATCFPAIGVTPEVTGILGVRYAYQPKTKQHKSSTTPAHRIGVIKGWDSQHTGSLKGSLHASDRMLDDIMIRKFIEGVMHEFLDSDIVIKRKANCISIVFLISLEGEISKFYFLMGLTEKLLTALLGCVVKVEAQSVFNDRKKKINR